MTMVISKPEVRVSAVPDMTKKIHLDMMEDGKKTYMCFDMS